MSLESRIKKHINSTLDSYTPNPYVKKRRFPMWAKIAIPLATAAVAVAVIVPIALSNNNLSSFIDQLEGTKIDNMSNVSAFCIWSAPNGRNSRPRLRTIAKVKDDFDTNLYLKNDSVDSSSNYDSSYSWTEEEKEQYEWEMSYDWDPNAASVLVSMDNEGKIKEVVYERTNGEGVVRQDTLGNCAAVFTSKRFTYVMYVSDGEWDYWKQGNYAQEMINPSGFHCHHNELQTIVIHNQTGKVFPLKDLTKQVDKYSNGKNYTMQAVPSKDDFISVKPMYGNLVPQLYDVIYDEEQIRYDFVIPDDSHLISDFDWKYTISDAKRDIYGQKYVLVSDTVDFDYRGNKDIAELSEYEIHDNTLVFFKENEILRGSDQRMYAFKNGTLNVFGKNFELAPVVKDTAVSFEGINGALVGGNHIENDTGTVYHLKNNYLYSIFGDVYKVEENGSYSEYARLDGAFPTYPDEGFLIEDSIVAFVNAQNKQNNPNHSTDGEVVQMTFGLVDGHPSVTNRNIIDATGYHFHGERMTIDVKEESVTKQYILRLKDGEAYAEHVVNRNGGGASLVKPITEPLNMYN